MHWSEIQVFSTGFDDITGYERLRALADFRAGGLRGMWYLFDPIGEMHEDMHDVLTWGPYSPDDVDWTGLDITMQRYS